jgi:hypothetical protein
MPRLCLLALALFVSLPGQLLTLEVRVYRGSEDVTSQARVTVHRAGERGQPIARTAVGEPPHLKLPAGIYDAQAVQEHEGRLVNIRWAERLVVMPYPDEGGHHLEVINFTPGYGALQIREASTVAPVATISLFLPSDRVQPAASAALGDRFTLFVVRAGRYDIQVKRGSRTSWHQDIEVPLDRTRLWIVP